MLCEICKESGDKSHVIVLTDKKCKAEIKGCKTCIDKLWVNIRSVDGRDKMTNEKVLSLVGLNIDDFEVRELRK